MNTADPTTMAPAERLAEIAQILAGAFQRLRARNVKAAGKQGGHAVRDAAHAVGRGAKEAGHAVGGAAKQGWHATKKAVKGSD